MDNFDLKKYLAEGKLLKEALNKSLMDFGKDVKAFLETKDLNVKLAKGDPQPYYKPIGEDPSLAALVLSSQGTELYIIINDSKMNVLEDIVKKYNLKTLVDMKKSGGWDQDTNKKTQSKGEIYMDQEVNKSRKGDTFALNVRKFDPSEIKENDIKEDILSFLKNNKAELIQVLTNKFGWDEDDIEEESEKEILQAGDSEGNEDHEIAGLGEGGLDFSFNPDKVKDTYGDASNFTIRVGGKTIYGIRYNF